ncbi:hypothetical protein Vau01_052180 [Virgisporangium aurantiacum]|uniref:Uncharacterized protein n=1 Tax=Virgisporangium aurantiacum TaxID=175570 RepID=A0A8J4E368_9ACTN|nr:hypothetical protein Vau01_052180 [Virgisporangium aurantiacum]
MVSAPTGPGHGTTTSLTARHAVVVAIGSSALLPDVTGLREAAPWTSREAAAASEVPGRLAVIGGGVVASEMATAFANLGSVVTVLARDGVLPLAEPFVGERVTKSLLEFGVAVRDGAEAATVNRNGDGTVHITLTDGEQVEADELLVTIGRTPNTQDIGLDRIGLKPGAWLAVDDTLRVVGEDGALLGDGWLYAAGDVNRRVLLTHQGKYQARAVGDVIVARAKGEAIDDGRWGRHVATADEHAGPQVIFTDPEVASVGQTAAAAEAAGLRIRVVDHDLAAVARSALHAKGYQGHARMVVDEDRQVIVGFTLVGPDVAELLHAATIAVVGEIPTTARCRCPTWAVPETGSAITSSPTWRFTDTSSANADLCRTCSCSTIRPKPFPVRSRHPRSGHIQRRPRRTPAVRTHARRRRRTYPSIADHRLRPRQSVGVMVPKRRTPQLAKRGSDPCRVDRRAEPSTVIPARPP